jgi:hypothetical protein
MKTENHDTKQLQEEKISKTHKWEGATNQSDNRKQKLRELRRRWVAVKGREGEREGGGGGLLPDAQYRNHDYIEVALDKTSAAEAENGV